MVRQGPRAGYLLDTHVLIWALADAEMLSTAQRTVLMSGDPLLGRPVGDRIEDCGRKASADRES
jgi:hypothetical protein